MKTFWKKGGTVIAITVLSATALVACSGVSGGNKSGSAEKGEIVWDMWGGSTDDQKWISETAKIAMKQNPDIKVKTHTAPWSDYFTKLTTNMATGNLACITSMNGRSLGGMYQAFSPLTDEDLQKAGIKKEDFSPASFSYMTHDNTLYGIPFDYSTMLMFYNKDMFKETNTPEPKLDWKVDDFLKAARSVSTEKHKGFGIGVGEFQWMAIPISQSGVQPATADGKLQMDNPEFVKAANWYADLVLKEKVATPPASASDSGWGEGQYSTGKVAMAIDGTWNADSYFKNTIGFKAGATIVPRQNEKSKSLVLGSGFGISATCENREAALKVLGSLVSKEAQDLVAKKVRSYPSRISSQPLYFESIDKKYRDDMKNAFDAAFKNIENQNTTVNWDESSLFVQPRLINVYQGREAMTKLLTDAQGQFGNR